MSIRKAKSLPLHALPRAAAPARSWCPASTRIARTPTRSIHRSAIRLDTKPTLKDGTAAKDLSELTLDDVQSASAELQSTDLLDVYNSLVARGLIVWDAEQVRCVMEVSSGRLARPSNIGSSETLLARSFGNSTTSSKTTPHP